MVYLGFLGVVSLANRLVGTELTEVEIAKVANALLEANNREPTATRRWAGRLMRRREDLFHCVRTRSKAWVRKAAQKREDIRELYKMYRDVKEKEGILDDNEWNGDESGYRVGVVESGVHVWTYVDIPTVEAANPDNRTLVTVFEAISASGKKTPAFVILPGQLIRIKHLTNSLDDGTILATSPNGYTDDQISLEWFDHWEQHSRPYNHEEKRLLLLDNHGSHCTVEFFQRCVAANVILFLLPPHSTHYCQPLDVGIFQICKHFHQVDILRRVNYGAVDYNTLDFLNGLRYIRERAMTESNIRAAWRKSGLNPWNPDLVLKRLPDPISSVTNDNTLRSKPGYIADPSEAEDILRLEEQRRLIKRLQEDAIRSGNMDPALPDPTLKTPPKKAEDWSKAVTPQLNRIDIQRYNEFIDKKIQTSVTNQTPVSPTTVHVINKRDKATQALVLLSMQEQHQKKVNKRKALDTLLSSRNKLVARYGPVVVGDARLREAADDYNRIAIKQSERARQLKKDLDIERSALRRWVSYFIANRKEWIKNERVRLRAARKSYKEQQAILQPRKKEMGDLNWLASQYRQQRQLRWDNYCAEKQRAKDEEARRLSRPVEDISLPLNWVPPGDDPRRSKLPWLYTDERKALVEDVITAWLQSKEIGVRDLDCMVVASTPADDVSDSDVQSVCSGATDEGSDEGLGEDGGVGLACI